MKKKRQLEGHVTLIKTITNGRYGQDASKKRRITPVEVRKIKEISKRRQPLGGTR